MSSRSGAADKAAIARKIINGLPPTDIPSNKAYKKMLKAQQLMNTIDNEPAAAVEDDAPPSQPPPTKSSRKKGSKKSAPPVEAPADAKDDLYGNPNMPEPVQPQIKHKNTEDWLRTMASPTNCEAMTPPNAPATTSHVPPVENPTMAWPNGNPAPRNGTWMAENDVATAAPLARSSVGAPAPAGGVVDGSAHMQPTQPPLMQPQQQRMDAYGVVQGMEVPVGVMGMEGGRGMGGPNMVAPTPLPGVNSSGFQRPMSPLRASQQHSAYYGSPMNPTPDSRAPMRSATVPASMNAHQDWMPQQGGYTPEAGNMYMGSPQMMGMGQDIGGYNMHGHQAWSPSQMGGPGMPQRSPPSAYGPMTVSNGRGLFPRSTSDSGNHARMDGSPPVPHGFQAFEKSNTYTEQYRAGPGAPVYEPPQYEKANTYTGQYRGGMPQGSPENPNDLYGGGGGGNGGGGGGGDQGGYYGDRHGGARGSMGGHGGEGAHGVAPGHQHHRSGSNAPPGGAEGYGHGSGGYNHGQQQQQQQQLPPPPQQHQQQQHWSGPPPKGIPPIGRKEASAAAAAAAAAARGASRGGEDYLHRDPHGGGPGPGQGPGPGPSGLLQPQRSFGSTPSSSSRTSSTTSSTFSGSSGSGGPSGRPGSMAPLPGRGQHGPPPPARNSMAGLRSMSVPSGRMRQTAGAAVAAVAAASGGQGGPPPPTGPGGPPVSSRLNRTLSVTASTQGQGPARTGGPPGAAAAAMLTRTVSKNASAGAKGPALPRRVMSGLSKSSSSLTKSSSTVGASAAGSAVHRVYIQK